MKMKDAIKLGIGFYIGKQLADFICNISEPLIIRGIGKIQDVGLGYASEFERKSMLSKYRECYLGTKYRKQTVSNKKNPIGFV